MSSYTITQWRCVMTFGMQTTTSKSVWVDNEGWTDFEDAYQQYESLKLTGQTVYMEKRELTVTRYKDKQIQEMK